MEVLAFSVSFVCFMGVVWIGYCVVELLCMQDNFLGSLDREMGILWRLQGSINFLFIGHSLHLDFLMGLSSPQILLKFLSFRFLINGMQP